LRAIVSVVLVAAAWDRIANI